VTISSVWRAVVRRFGTQCPHCGSIDYRNVGATQVEERLLWWLLQPCRCDFCGRHFYLFRWQVVECVAE